MFALNKEDRPCGTTKPALAFHRSRQQRTQKQSQCAQKKTGGMREANDGGGAAGKGPAVAPAAGVKAGPHRTGDRLGRPSSQGSPEAPRAAGDAICRSGDMFRRGGPRGSSRTPTAPENTAAVCAGGRPPHAVHTRHVGTRAGAHEQRKRKAPLCYLLFTRIVFALLMRNDGTRIRQHGTALSRTASLCAGGVQ